MSNRSRARQAFGLVTALVVVAAQGGPSPAARPHPVASLRAIEAPVAAPGEVTEPVGSAALQSAAAAGVRFAAPCSLKPPPASAATDAPEPGVSGIVAGWREPKLDRPPPSV